MFIEFLQSNQTANLTCSAVAGLPYQGTEVLMVGALLLVVVISWAVVYLDVVAKQWSPSTMVAKSVMTRVAWIQSKYPNIKLSEEEKLDLYTDSDKSKYHFATLEDGSKVEYDSVAAQEAYISSKTVDLDLLTSLANNSAYSTMSGYSANTTRGYNMLSTTLSGSAFCCVMFCLSNFVVNPRASGETNFSIFGYLFAVRFGLVGLFFYPGILCTSIVMTTAGSTVWRESNICLFSNVPYYLNGKYNPIRHLHVGGVVLFAIPIFCHLFQALGWGKSTMPNYATASYLFIVTLVFALTFAASRLFGTKYLPNTTKLQGKKVSIFGEAGMMFACILSYVHWETYAIAVCSGNEQYWEKLIVGAFFAPFAFVARNQFWAPTDFSTDPSLMLMRHGQPVATVGPCPSKAYRGATMASTTSSNSTADEQATDSSALCCSAPSFLPRSIPE